MGRRKPLPALENLEITGVAAEGKALGKWNDKVVFVPYAHPGDVLNAQVIKKRKNYLEARITELKQPASERLSPFCDHFGLCGGCKWQHMSYELQLQYKQQQVVDNLSRIAKVELPDIAPILGSSETQYYRNKLEFTFSNQRWVTEEEIANEDQVLERRGLGFHIPGKFDKILDVDHCYLQGSISNKIRNAIRDFAISDGLSFYNVREHQGLLRNLIIRTSSTGEVMVIVSFGESDQESITKVMEYLGDNFHELTSLMYVINLKKNDTLYDQEILCFHGNDYIMEEMEGIKFRIGPKSFYQTNSTQAYELYKIARDFAELNNSQVLYDLYTGTGTIANFLSRNVKQVIGIESVPEAIEDAKENASINGIDNAKFVAGDMMNVLTEEFFQEHGKPDVIVTDPPRAGMHDKVNQQLLNSGAHTIVYVSCNPATQARDLAQLDEKYVVTKVQPVDMFPHTHHVENVVQLKLRK